MIILAIAMMVCQLSSQVTACDVAECATCVTDTDNVEDPASCATCKDEFFLEAANKCTACTGCGDGKYASTPCNPAANQDDVCEDCTAHCTACDAAVCTKCKCGYKKSPANETAVPPVLEGATCVVDEANPCSGAAAFGLTTILLLPVTLASIFSV